MTLAKKSQAGSLKKSLKKELDAMKNSELAELILEARRERRRLNRQQVRIDKEKQELEEIQGLCERVICQTKRGGQTQMTLEKFRKEETI